MLSSSQWTYERLKALVNATSQIVWVADASGQVTGQLENWQEYTGQSDREIQGAGWANALHPEDIEQALETWRQAVARASSYHVEYRIRRRDGVYRQFLVRGEPVLNTDGSIREWIGTCMDIEEQNIVSRAIAANAARLRSTLDAAKMGTFDWDLQTGTIEWSSWHHVLWNMSPEEFDGTFSTAVKRIHPDDLAELLRNVENCRSSHNRFTHEFRVVWKDGSIHWIGATAECQFGSDATPVRMQGTVVEITDRKLFEVRMLELNRELELRVQERTAELLALNKELEAFSYSISHDLRAPLRSIDGFTRIALEDYGPLLDDEGQRILNIIRGETHRMGQLIDDLLSFARCAGQKLRYDVIDMTQLVQEVYQAIAPEARQHIKRFTVSSLPHVYGDRSLIRQVWFNLISNAVKFTIHQPQAAINIHSQSADGLITYSVCDNGVGFDPRYTHKLFGVFQRLHAEEEFEGTGVGLALVQRIIARHKGQIRGEGRLNHGATFHFSLPIPTEPIDGHD